VCPASVIGGFIRALEIQKAAYEKENGEIRDLGAHQEAKRNATSKVDKSKH
jgi:hypothetical protein